MTLKRTLLFTSFVAIIIVALWLADTIRPLGNPSLGSVQFDTFIPRVKLEANIIEAKRQDIMAIAGVQQVSISANNDISICYNSSKVNTTDLINSINNIIGTEVNTASSNEPVSKCPVDKAWLNSYRNCFNFLQPIFQLSNK